MTQTIVAILVLAASVFGAADTAKGDAMLPQAGCAGWRAATTITPISQRDGSHRAMSLQLREILP